MTSTWRTDVQGLRAVAVCLVIAGHAGLAWAPGGFVGVDVFFVLSGFLITSLLLREAAQDGRVSISRFYARRARRILPAATVTMVVVLAFCALTLPENRTDATAADAGWAAAFLANVHFAREAVDYFSTAAPSPFQHYWSLSVEEQFYLVWPLLILALSSRRLRGFCAKRIKLPGEGRLALAPTPRELITGVAGLVVVGSLAWSLYATAHDATAAYFSTPARAFELGAGALLACAAPLMTRLTRYFRVALGIGGLALLVAAAEVFSEGSAFPGWRALVPVAGTLALLAAGPATPTGRVLSLPPLRYVGDISYSLYLWHWPVLVLAPAVIPGSGLPQLAIMLVVVAAISAASYHLVERPFQTRRVPILSRGRRALALWPAALALALAAGTSAEAYAGHETAVREAQARVWFTKHAPESASGKNVSGQLNAALDLADNGAPLPPGVTFDKHDTWEDRYGYCFATWGASTREPCVYGDTSGAKTVAVIGDSHAGMWLPALDTLARREHVRLVPFVKLACAAYDVTQPTAKMPQAECDAFRSWTRDQVDKLHPDTIVLASRGLLQVKDRGGVTKEKQWSDGVRRAVSHYEQVTDDVRVLSDVPRRPDPGTCLSDAANRLADCVAERTGDEVASNPLTQAALRDTGATYVDTTGLVCSDRCPLVVDKDVLYYDPSHLTATWVNHVTQALGRRLGDLRPA